MAEALGSALLDGDSCELDESECEGEPLAVVETLTRPLLLADTELDCADDRLAAPLEDGLRGGDTEPCGEGDDDADAPRLDDTERVAGCVAPPVAEPTCTVGVMLMLFDGCVLLEGRGDGVATVLREALPDREMVRVCAPVLVEKPDRENAIDALSDTRLLGE